MKEHIRYRKWKERCKFITSLPKEEITLLEMELLIDCPELAYSSDTYEMLFEEKDVQDIIKRAAMNGWSYFRKVRDFGCGCDWTGINSTCKGRPTRIPELVELRIREIQESSKCNEVT